MPATAHEAVAIVRGDMKNISFSSGLKMVGIPFDMLLSQNIFVEEGSCDYL